MAEAPVPERHEPQRDEPPGEVDVHELVDGSSLGTPGTKLLRRRGAPRELIARLRAQRHTDDRYDQ
ncbi:hypothetical protein GCM10023196_037390 [Actinoallomurus vinaceus]|uniref:Uncharacterized protein n=1 Tax=Actinoallomurus vinaceus TaxID=1080074 RepID=A0ABP8UB51_9ACTN